MKLRKSIFLIAVLLLVTLSLSAQTKVPVTIIASEGPAQIILNGKLYGMANPQMTIQLEPGNYALIVRKSGVGEFRQTITVRSSPLTIHAPLGTSSGQTTQPAPEPTTGPTPNTVPTQRPPNQIPTQIPTSPQKRTYSLHIISNVSGASVYINSQFVGTTPFKAKYPAGTHTITVTAPNYIDFSQTIQLNKDTSINANFSKPVLVPFHLGNLVSGAEIYLNDSKIGTAPRNGEFQTKIQQGYYTLTIRAQGYVDFQMQIQVGQGGYNYRPVMQPLNASFRIQIPGLPADASYKINSPWNQVRVYIDNSVLQNYSGQTIEVDPGSHTIIVESGIFKVQQTQTFTAGKHYEFEPFTGMNVR